MVEIVFVLSHLTNNHLLLRVQRQDHGARWIDHPLFGLSLQLMFKQDGNKKARDAVSSFITSSTLSRITRLFQHIFPNNHAPTIQQTIRETNRNPPKRHFHNLLCINCAGNTHHLTIANAVEHAQEFQDNEYLHRTLLNTSNDAINFANMLSNITRSFFDFSIHGQVTVKDAIRLIRSSHQQLIRNTENDGLIIFWSGHGKAVKTTQGALHIDQMGHRELQLEMTRSDHDTNMLPISSITDEWNKLQRNRFHPLLLVLDCCHSGLAVTELGTWGSNSCGMCLIITSCSDDDISGGWVMDGANTGGILTNFLTDPIATYFKVQFNVFYDFGGDLFTPPMLTFYEIFQEHIDRVIDDSGLRPVFDRLLIRAGDHIVKLFKHFMLLLQYGDKLYYPQLPKSFPDLSPCISSPHWKDMELAIEKLILELWRERYKQNV
jgi:hypothetical protein